MKIFKFDMQLIQNKRKHNISNFKICSLKYRNSNGNRIDCTFLTEFICLVKITVELEFQLPYQLRIISSPHWVFTNACKISFFFFLTDITLANRLQLEFGINKFILKDLFKKFQKVIKQEFNYIRNNLITLGNYFKGFF